MSNYYQPQPSSQEEEDNFDLTHIFPTQSTQSQQSYHQQQSAQTTVSAPDQLQYYQQPTQYYQQPSFYPPAFEVNPNQHQQWMAQPPIVPSNYPPELPLAVTHPQFSQTFDFSQGIATAGPSTASAGYLSPDEAMPTRPSRSTSFASNASSVASISQSDVSRSVSPNASEMAKWGFRNENGSWSCSYPACSSKSTFSRGCDLRKHYRRHTKSLFCRHEGCPQATEGGFSSQKDRARHEAKHNPNIVCTWEGCDRLFSRVDNMKDHVRRVHKRKLAQ